jgi:hypothetical protein
LGRNSAFESEGSLYAADYAGYIDEFTPGGTRSPFASGLSRPMFLAFEPAVIPESSSWAMLGQGAAGLVTFRRRKICIQPRLVAARSLSSRSDDMTLR